MDALGEKGAEPPSNVTRISRVLCRTCADGTPQVICYFPGVGTGNKLDQFTGGAFGMGLDRDIREVYNLICTNYVDGDEIILIGFSRGAFTARSVADMVASLGLLTPDGLDVFYAVFEDYEGMGNVHRKSADFLVPGLEEWAGQVGKAKEAWEERRKEAYRIALRGMGHTRDTFTDGTTPITIKALGVWDTVGALGIPPAPVVGIRGSADEWTFTNTQVSDKVENAFQALALDEPRYAFRPALWERVEGNRTNLKQVWFPGTQCNVGGGWYDQGMANITLAWMCDQLATVGVEFSYKRMAAVFRSVLHYQAAHPFPAVPSHVSDFFKGHAPLPWARQEVYNAYPNPTRDAHDCDKKDHHPETGLWDTARPWALGQLRDPTSALQKFAGRTVRTPGLGVRVDPDTNEDVDEPLLRTGERVHSSVRVRLACQGLSVDDQGVWGCEALLKDGKNPLWELERGSGFSDEEEAALRRFRTAEDDLGDKEYPTEKLYDVDAGRERWRWIYQKKPGGKGEEQVPQSSVLPEEPLVGYWERLLLGVTVGKPDAWMFAETQYEQR
jgi:hypothetical protein